MAHHWAPAPRPREQIALFSPTLEEMIGEDHPVRLLDEILRGIDWSPWVTPCGEHRGRPPIHPRILAGIILYGLTHRFRSSRVLEYMCGHNLDFIWLAEGHQPDHTNAVDLSQGVTRGVEGFVSAGWLAGDDDGAGSLGRGRFRWYAGEGQRESLRDLDGCENRSGARGLGAGVRADDGRGRRRRRFLSR